MDYRLSKIINIVRSLNEEMSANVIGTSGGFGSNPSKSGVDGFDPVMKGPIRRRNKKILGAGNFKGARGRFKKGVDLITNFKKNKYM